MSLIFTDTNFEEEVLKSEIPALVDFWAPWCGPCQMMGSIVDDLAVEFEGKNIKIGKMNVDENPEMAARYEVMSIPAFKIFKSGEVADEISGAAQKERLAEMITKYI